MTEYQRKALNELFNFILFLTGPIYWNSIIKESKPFPENWKAPDWNSKKSFESQKCNEPQKCHICKAYYECNTQYKDRWYCYRHHP